MAEYAATALSLTPVKGTWRDVLSRICAYLQQNHRPYPAPPQRGTLLAVDCAQRQVTSTWPFELSASIGSEPEGVEYWRSVTVELWFGRNSDYLVICVREAQPGVTHVELGFSTSVHEAVFSFDPGEKTINLQVKSDLMRLFTGVATALRVTGFGYQFAEEDSLFGPPSIDILRDYVEGEYRSHAHEPRMLIVAGLVASEVREEEFVYDVDDPHPVRYRQDDYYLCDRLWPLD